MKPLFIPLKTEHFNAFKSGDKLDELRRYGPRWNEKTCSVGRDVTLSKGYSKAHRLQGRITRFKRQHGSTFGSTYRAAIQSCYGTLNIYIACISIDIGKQHLHHGRGDAPCGAYLFISGCDNTQEERSMSGTGDSIEIELQALEIKRGKLLKERAERDAKKGFYWCAVCGVNPVNAEDGFDTCESCLKNI